MRELHNSFLTRQFLRSVWALDYEGFKDTNQEAALLDLLRRWSERTDLGERSAEAAFIEEFLHRTWGYVQSGQPGGESAFTLYPQFPVPGSGAGGGSGTADAALGHFLPDQTDRVPQVLCEFKDTRSSLDAPQRRKGSNRSPVQQGLDYLSAARRGFFGNEPILPTWAIVTNMNEFRLYWADRGPRQFMRFTIRPTDLFQGQALTADAEEARFDRFLFCRLFHADSLLVRGGSGRSALAQLIAQQWVREREVENDFYKDYRAYREHLYSALLQHNGSESPRFPGTHGRLVRLAQKILDRCIFIFFCEDMGGALGFPPQLLRDFLIHESNDNYFDPEAYSIWHRLVGLFRAMDEGTAFGGRRLNQFNGGLFAVDHDLEVLNVPNRVFCQQAQGQNEAGLYSFPLTLLYLSASYNYAAGWSRGLARPPVADPPDPAEPVASNKNLGLYMLGRIFEQSITELEILEADAEGRPSVNKESKRKRDGVYYTPEWVVERIVAEALGSRLADLKAACGWPRAGSDALPDEAAIAGYERGLRGITVVDPACGSGAFLITALRYLLDEWHAVRDMRRQVSGSYTTRDDEDDRLIGEILRSNLYGVDINPASVEIAKLALWLHTARGDRPLSSLDHTIRVGNSLIGPDFYDGLDPYPLEQQERINAFDWRATFPEVFACGGFDVVIGNPPYVKLQNFRKAHADMATFLQRDRANRVTYESTQTGNFDLYLPFIEKGIALLSENGRLGYIAPSLWTMNEYGEGLRELIMRRRHLYGWIDFGSFQVFDEATTYTALQFFSKSRNAALAVAAVPDGAVPAEPWSGNDAVLEYERLTFGERWLLTTGPERDLIDRLYRSCARLDDPTVTDAIFVGIQTSADDIYHLTRLGPGRYRCTPSGRGAPPPYEVQIEDAIMKPLVSGAEAKRYVEPATETYLLFPYSLDDEARLLPAFRMAAEFPCAWAYLRSWESRLRAREGGAFDDDRWYRFGRHQNLEKQQLQKLIVPRLVTTVSSYVDSSGFYYLDNVDVGGVVTCKEVSPFFIGGLLNGPVLGFVFRRISKPFRGGFRSANKQFIAPLPVPKASDAEAAVADAAERLQALHTRRRDVLVEIGRRMAILRYRNRPLTWLFPDLPPERALLCDAPVRLDVAERREWAAARFELELDARVAALGTRITPGVTLDATIGNGELRFLVDGLPVVERIFLADDEGRFVLAQWKLLASTFSVTPTTDGKRLAKALRRIGETDNPAVAEQIVALQQRLAAVEADIADGEAAMNALIYRLYDLSEDDIRLVERG